MEAAGKTDLTLFHLDDITPHYATTLKLWREAFLANADRIREMGFESYFLIVWDLIRWARENDIPVGPGRGSAAGSIVAYVLDITRVDPLKYGLIFERFLNSARISMPDIDIDFCKEGREKVLQYTRDRYGSENVAQIVGLGAACELASPVAVLPKMQIGPSSPDTVSTSSILPASTIIRQTQ